MPVNARRLIRKMRGGAQAHLLEADDGHFYVVKFRNTPQHRRILICEWICWSFLKYLGIASREATVVNLTEDFLAANPEVHIELGSSRSAVPTGWHFGSRYPGDPATTAVYDFVPDVLLQQVENLTDFAGMLVLDKWMSNADARQSIFVRGRVRDYAPSLKAHPRQLGFLALMMDHGFQFYHPHRPLSDSPVH